MVTTTRHRRRDTTTADDDVLVARAREGDATAFARLYDRHAPAVTRLVGARVPPSVVDEVVADVFVRAWRSLRSYTGRRPLRAWLFGIARHAVADSYRSAGRRPTSDLDEVDGDPAAPDPHGQLLTRMQLRDVLGLLPARQRRVVELKYFAALTNDEVAEALGMSPGAVNATQWRALQRLRTLLEDDT